jgi:hypothetical protein
MAFDFPASPAIDEVYTDPVSGATYKWNGEKWLRQPNAPPPAPLDADSPEATIERFKAQHEKE